uniref:Sugar transporter n=1 Tax=Panagrolaimus sp. ES5 TaxID=591445 RepID=A0AC34FRS5_9BILA
LDTVLRQFDREFLTTETSHTTFRQLWADPTLRDSLYLVFVTSLIPYFGLPQIFYLYGIPLKIRYGFTNEQALYLDLILSFVFVPIFFVIPYLYERIGRRPIFLVTNFLSVAGSATVLFAQIYYRFYGTSSTFTIILAGIFSFLFMLVNAMGASIFYVILIADLLPASAKAATSQAALLSSSISAIIANFVYAILEPILGSGVFIPFVLIQICFVFYCYRNLPETKQKAVYENYEIMRSRSNSIVPILSKSRRVTANSLHTGMNPLKCP